MSAEEIERLFEASRRYLRWYYTRPKMVYQLSCDIDDFLDIVLYNLSKPMRKSIEKKKRHYKTKRELKRAIFLAWKVITGELFYYKLGLDGKAKRDLHKQFYDLRRRGYTELEAHDKVTDGDDDLRLGKFQTRADISMTIQICLSDRLPLRTQKYLLRSKHIDRLLQELNAL